MRSLRLLVCDAYAPEGRAALRGAGATEAGLLYERTLLRLAQEDAGRRLGARLSGFAASVSYRLLRLTVSFNC